MKRNQISLNKLMLDNLVPINPEKREEEMTARMVRGGVVAEEEGEEGLCSLICKALVQCQVRCLGCPMDLVILEPHHFPD